MFQIIKKKLIKKINLQLLSTKDFSRNIKQQQSFQEQNKNQQSNDNSKKKKILNQEKIKTLLENKFEEKQLNEMIKQKIDSGKDDKQIIQELLGMPQEINSNKYILKDKERIKKNRLDISNIFNIDRSELNKIINQETKPSKDDLKKMDMANSQKNKYQREVQIYQDQIEIMEQIQENSKYKKLPERGLNSHNNKMTRSEKDEINLNLVIMKQDILDRGELPPKEYVQRKEHQIKTYQYIKDEEIEQITSKQDSQTQQQQEQQLLQIQKQETKKKPIQKKEEKNALLKDLKNLSMQDADSADKSLDIFYEEAKVGDRFKKAIVERNFGEKVDLFKQDQQKHMMLMKKHNLDEDFMDDVEDLTKSHLFQMKQLEEENAQFAKKMKEREQRKSIKKIMKDIEDRDLREDMDFESDSGKVGKVRQDKEFDKMVPDLEQLKRAEEQDNDKYQLDREEELYGHHQLRTTNNYTKFLNMYFFNNNKSSIMGVTCGRQLELKEVITNNALTVVYVFWDFLHLNNIPDIENTVSQNLKKYSKMLRGQMCNKLQLKYAPDIRFVKSESKIQIDHILKDMQEQIPKIIMNEVELEYENNVAQNPSYKKIYTKQELQEKCQDYYETFKEGVEIQFTHDQQIIDIKNSKMKQFQYDQNGKKIRQNRNTDGSKKKTKKSSKNFDKFWNSLEE